MVRTPHFFGAGNATGKKRIMFLLSPQLSFIYFLVSQTILKWSRINLIIELFQVDFHNNVCVPS